MRIQELLKEGDLFYEAAEWDRAVDLYQTATDLDWQHPESASLLVGAVYRRAYYSKDARHRESAIATCREVIRRNPDVIEAKWYLARALDDIGQVEEAYALALEYCCERMNGSARYAISQEKHLARYAMEASHHFFVRFMGLMESKIANEPIKWPEMDVVGKE